MNWLRRNPTRSSRLIIRRMRRPCWRVSTRNPAACSQKPARRNRLADEDETKISPTGTWVLEDKDHGGDAGVARRAGARHLRRRQRVTAHFRATGLVIRHDVAGSTAIRPRKCRGPAAMRWIWIWINSKPRSLLTRSQQPRKGVEEEQFASDVFGAKDLAATDLDLDVGEVKHDRDRAPTGTARIPADRWACRSLSQSR